MTPRERVRRTLTCRRPDRVPKALGFFAQSLAAIDPTAPEDYFDLEVRFAEFSRPRAQTDFLSYLDSLPRHVHVGNMEQLRTYHEWGYHPERGPSRPLDQIHTVEALKDYAFPDLNDRSRYAGLNQQVADWHTAGLAVAAGPPHLGGVLFETAWRMRNFDNFMLDMLERKDLIHYLLDQLTTILVHSVIILAEAGIDVLLLDDDVAMPTGLLIGPDTWREFFKPRMKKAIDLAREISPDIIVFYHSDGDFTRLIPDLISIGVSAINPVQPDCMDLVAIKQEFGDRLAIWGAVGSARLWDYGTPEQMRAEVKRVIKTLGPEGLLLAPAYDIDFSPFENVVAFVEAVEEFGRL